jgi:hypothetical protein
MDFDTNICNKNIKLKEPRLEHCHTQENKKIGDKYSLNMTEKAGLNCM